MAELLNDAGVRRILGSVIKDGVDDSVRPNKGERPESLYVGAYQDKVGYVRSERSGAPVGMRPDDWVDAATSEGP